MSCTVAAIPYALLWIISSVITKTDEVQSDRINYTEPESNTNTLPITEQHFIEKTFETPFMDKEILKKTLTEHGVTNISEWENGIAGDYENYKLMFEKPAEDKAFNLKIQCRENDNAEETVNDIHNEYTMNVQEDAYLHILNKIKENNMQIESEEVEEDNTIVLTINID